MPITFWLINIKESDKLEDLNVDGSIILKFFVYILITQDMSLYELIENLKPR